jgi:uncharacterized membrane protein
MPVPQGTSIVNTEIAANLPWSLLATYKYVFPLIFAGVPVVLYYIFRTWLDDIKAFLAAFVFIIFPAFFMELPGIAREMIAEVVLVGILFLLIRSTIRKRYLLPLVGIGGALLPLLHYSVSLVSLLLLAPIALLVKGKRLAAGITLGVIVITSAVYFPIAQNGAVAIKLAYLWNQWAPAYIHINAPDLPSIEPYIPIPVEPGPTINPEYVPFLQRYESLIQSGLGLDFFTTTIAGKIFRIIQWGVGLLSLIGLWKLRKHWRYLIGGGLLFGLLIVPGFSSILNVTRVLHIGLLLLAPITVIALKPRWMLPILVSYFLFTSGLIFETTNQSNIEQVTIPYNVALSNYRVDMGADTTLDDLKVRDYAYQHNLFPILSDIHTSDLIGETIGIRADLNVALFRDPFKVPKGVYIFVRSRNIKDGTFTVWAGVGRRKTVKPEEYGINWNEGIIYQSGDARIVEVK